MDALLVVLGAAVGAPFRLLTDRAVTRRAARSSRSARTGRAPLFPYGILVVNASGSLLLGAVLAAERTGALPHAGLVLLGTGFCGAYTTFSTFAYETLLLVEAGAVRTAVLNVAVSTAAGLAAAAAGWGLGSLTG